MRRPVRVLFLAWGYSIHGERRIRLFCDDPDFTVAVASPFDYRFDRARYWALPAATGVAPAQEAVRLAKAGLRLRRIVREFRPDVLFLQTLLYPGFLGLAAANLPKLITFWNGDLLSYEYSTGLERVVKKGILSRGLTAAAGITVNSEAARQACLAHGAAPEKVHLIRYPGIDVTQFRPMEQEPAKRALGLAGHPVILNERGAVPHKHAELLVRAAPAVLTAFPHARFLFLSPEKGAGPAAFAPYQKLARELGVNEAMVWHGHVPYAELPAVINAADVWVSLSTADSMPNSMLDAMACGVPVVSADLPQIREWVQDGVTGSLVDPFDAAAVAGAITALLAAPAHGAHMARRAAQQIHGRADFVSQVAAIKHLVRSVAGG